MDDARHATDQWTCEYDENTEQLTLAARNHIFWEQMRWMFWAEKQVIWARKYPVSPGERRRGTYYDYVTPARERLVLREGRIRGEVALLAKTTWDNDSRRPRSYHTTFVQIELSWTSAFGEEQWRALASSNPLHLSNAIENAMHAWAYMTRTYNNEQS